jgi:membrane fusion protein (multidrug efflux system)
LYKSHTITKQQYAIELRQSSASFTAKKSDCLPESSSKIKASDKQTDVAAANIKRAKSLA